MAVPAAAPARGHKLFALAIPIAEAIAGRGTKDQRGGLTRTDPTQQVERLTAQWDQMHPVVFCDWDAPQLVTPIDIGPLGSSGLFAPRRVSSKK